jgi:hypothetical protein
MKAVSDNQVKNSIQDQLCELQKRNVFEGFSARCEIIFTDGKFEVAWKKSGRAAVRTEQRVITLTQRDAQHYNFFHSPGSIGSLESLSREGWIVKDIIKLGEDNATVILQR